MPEIKMPYGDTEFTLALPADRVMDIVSPNNIDLPDLTSEQVVRQALDNPIASPKLGGLVKQGEKICLLVPDITRVFQAPYISVPMMAAELNKAGIADADITILFATGTHRRMTDAEHEKIVGPDIARRIKMIDHQSQDKADMRHMGETSRGTPVWFNRHAAEADKIVTVCGAIYHFLAGFGGGGKLLLPGIAADESIQANHRLALNPGFGSGMNPEVYSGNISPKNPFHADIFEAAAMLPPVFSLNVVADDNSRIIGAFAGEWRKAHAKACELVAALEGVKIPGQAGFVIASAGGAPKDINLYQSIKTATNAKHAAKPGADIIMLARCHEGFGDEHCQKLICGFDNMNDREKSLRENFSIGAFTGYFLAKMGEEYNFIIVTDMDASNFAKTRIRTAKTLDEAMRMAQEDMANPREAAIIMPHGAATLPILAGGQA